MGKKSKSKDWNVEVEGRVFSTYTVAAESLDEAEQLAREQFRDEHDCLFDDIVCTADEE